jgi:hypothetical protein
VDAPPPRLFGIPAREAPVVAVLRRGPSGWCHVGRWDVDSSTYESGAWLRGTLYPQRCDLSPDGRWLCYFALRAGASWSAGGTYVAVSRLPWLTALAAWGTDGTWTRGLHFTDDTDSWPLGDPDEGDAGPLRARYGVAYTRPASYAVERRSGWVETVDSPPQGEDDVWDEHRAERITMARPSPADGRLLTVRGGAAAFRSGPAGWWQPPTYALDGVPLEAVQWADWARDGRLLVATSDGRLQVRHGGTVHEVADLAALTPDPQPAPPDATRW